MQTNRRIWLKQISLASAAVGFSSLKTFSFPAKPAVDDPSYEPIHLSTNENPYGPSASARAAMTEAQNINRSNRYNWSNTTNLIAAIAKKNNVTYDNILLGAGSTLIIDLVVQLAAQKKGTFILADPTFNNWTKVAEQLEMKKIAVPLTSEKRHNLPAMLNAMQPDTRMIYVCNPNNPTGTVCNRDELITFINAATKKTIVLVDEAYIEYSDQQSVSELVLENKNLIVVKTFSKIYGLAGGRIGYAVAHTDTIHQLNQYQAMPDAGVSIVSAAGALATIKDENFVKECFALNEKARKYTIEQLERIDIPCVPSHTNFIYFSLINYKKDFFAQLQNNLIQGTRVWEENGMWSRITVGTIEEMQKFITAIK